MGAVSRWVVIAGLAVVSACGGASESGWGGGGYPEAERSPDSLPFPETGPPPAPLAMATWAPSGSIQNGPVNVYTDPGEIPELVVANTAKTKLPLEHTHVKARLTGFVAEVEVTQTYKNPNSEAIEAIYIFPLPENSAVDHMHMQIGKRVIDAEIKKRSEARQTYEAAKRQGKTAALLEQERPNVFTQSVANIAPGEKIDVTVRYVQDLSYDAGEYEFVFPMVVGPRYMPGQPYADPQTGTGTKADTTRVPDASRISPPYVGRGERSGHDISIEVLADATMAVSDFRVPTHQVASQKPAGGTLKLTLAEKKSLPNRDFVLKYRVAGDKPRATMFVSDERDGYFSLVVQPPALDIDKLVGRREIVFVVDVSGSMSGTPLGLCKLAMQNAIDGLRPVDTFNVITFAGSTGQAFANARPANTGNVREAMEYVGGLRAGGGTEMRDAVAAALGRDVERGRDRYVFFLTDGFVGNENEIIQASKSFVERLEHAGQRARVFGFGVGSSTNRYLLEGLSRAGKGVAVYASQREDPAEAVNRFYHYIDRAVLTDVNVDFGDARVSDVYPKKLPDLFASHALIVHGRFQALPKGGVTLSAKAGDQLVKLPVTLRAPNDGAPASVQGTLWARSKVSNLMEGLWEGNDPAIESQVTELGLKFHLITPFTSFVAVDHTRQVSSGNSTAITQPVEQPEGVDVGMAGGETMAPPVMDDSASSPSPAGMAPMEPESLQVDEGMRRGCGCWVRGPADRRPGWLVFAILGGAFIRRRWRCRRQRRA